MPTLPLRNSGGQKVLGVENVGTASGSRVVQWADGNSTKQQWQLLQAG
ncbi:MAG TPA: RICIN domain-containing protein [Nonomuraea sp.]|nr:RICIN domain-containing protein [Nonomuraea sp.]